MGGVSVVTPVFRERREKKGGGELPKGENKVSIDVGELILTGCIVSRITDRFHALASPTTTYFLSWVSRWISEGQNKW